jgi:hypothetical protein
MKKVVVFLAMVLIIIVMLPRYSQAGMKMEARGDYISGQIFYFANNKGISDMVVKLTPPRDFKEPQKTAITDQYGRFKFAGLKKGRYLLEVHQGPTLLYRDMVDMDKGSHKTIILRGEEKRYEPNIPLKVIPPEFKYE